MIGDATDFRARIIEALDLLSSSKKQLEYALSLPNVSVSSELVCLWFDDTYIPDDAFKRCFSNEELDAMAIFDNDFETRHKLLPENVGINELLENENWQQIMHQARRMLVVLQPDQW